MSNLLRGNLRQKLGELILFSAVVSVALFYLLNLSVSAALNRYFTMSDYIDNEYSKVAQDLQNTVTQNRLTLAQSGSLADWASKHRDVSISIYSDDGLLYSSDSSAMGGVISETDLTYDRVRYCTLAFADGTADAFLFGSFDYKFYIFTDLAELAVSASVFVAIILIVVSKRIGYIDSIEKSINAMEGGDLSNPVPVRGKDELSRLAASLDSMRVSFANQVRSEQKATEANRNLVTAMSHDLRTPLTALLLYAEILKDGKAKTEEEKQDCLQKIEMRAEQIKDLSDSLFRHFLAEEDEPTRLTGMQVRDVFPDLISDFICTLTAKGFSAGMEGDWPDAAVRINSDCLMRVMDNLLSNLFKYADPAEPILIRCGIRDRRFELTITNRIARFPNEEESSRIGLENAADLMRQMGGVFDSAALGDRYTARLFFPVARAL